MIARIDLPYRTQHASHQRQYHPKHDHSSLLLLACTDHQLGYVSIVLAALAPPQFENTPITYSSLSHRCILSSPSMYFLVSTPIPCASRLAPSDQPAAALTPERLTLLLWPP